MSFLEFLAQAKKKNFWSENKVICFCGEHCPLFFFRLLIEILKDKNTVSISHLKVENRRQLWETLKQCFLGETSFYWLGNVVESIKKKKSEPDIVEVLSHYRGPHSIAFFVPRDNKISVSTKKRMTFIDVPGAFSFQDIGKIFAFFGVRLTKSKNDTLHEVVKHADTINLDTVCMMMNYFVVTGIRLVDSLKKNLMALIEPELSLQSLSQAFFSKQQKKFFLLWSERHNDYAMPFWIAFWSEQLWRAYHVVKFLKQSNFPAARRFSFRLPPSFIRSDWRNCSIGSLQNGYKMLYDIDFAYKTGSTATGSVSFFSLDLFYCKYFLNDFSCYGDYA